MKLKITPSAFVASFVVAAAALTGTVSSAQAGGCLTATKYGYGKKEHKARQSAFLKVNGQINAYKGKYHQYKWKLGQMKLKGCVYGEGRYRCKASRRFCWK